MSLAHESCVACLPRSKAVVEPELSQLLAQLVGWGVEESSGISTLVRRYQFSDFATALAFTNKIGEIAEKENHHPSITLEWGTVTLRWWTHSINGLHRNDFIMAARSNESYG